MSRVEVHVQAANLAATAKWLQAEMAGEARIGQGEMTMEQFLLHRVLAVLTGKVVELSEVKGEAFDMVVLYQRVWGHFAIAQNAQYVGNRLQVAPGAFIENAIQRLDDGVDIVRECSVDDGAGGMFHVDATLFCCLK